MRFRVMRTLAVCVALGAGVACSGGGKPEAGTGSPAASKESPTPNGPELHLSVAVVTEGDFRDAVSFIIANPFVREQRCPEFLALSDLAASQHFEDLDASTHPNAPRVTPTPADQVQAGKILKSICQDFLTTTPTPFPKKTPTPTG